VKPIRRGVQVEIVANLFAMTFAGLAIAVVAMTSFTARLARDDALDRLRMGARHLEASLERAPRLSDLAALAPAPLPGESSNTCPAAISSPAKLTMAGSSTVRRGSRPRPGGRRCLPRVRNSN
jgi:hypothetical protein